MSRFSDRFIVKTSKSLENIPTTLVKIRWFVLAVFMGFTSFFGVGILDFKVNQAMEEFFQPDDPAMLRYKWFRYVFGSDDFLLVMYQPKNGGIFSEKNLQEVAKIEEKLNQEKDKEGSPLARIKRVRTIISADYLEGKNESLYNRKFIGDRLPQTEDEKALLKKLALEHPDYPGTYISKTGSHAVFMIETDFGSRLKNWKETQAEYKAELDLSDTQITQNDSESDEFDFGLEESAADSAPSASTSPEASKVVTIGEVPALEPISIELYGDFVAEIRKVFDEKSWTDSMTTNFAGNPWVMDFFNTVILKEIGMYAGMSLIVIWLVLLAAFRSFSALFWPSISLALSVVWTIGLIGHTGIEMTFMINIIIFLLLAVSIATSIHILSGYVFFTSKGHDPLQALKATYHKAGVPIVLAAFTTAMGMASLIFVPIKATQNFGIFASLGVLFTLVINIGLWPIYLSFWAPKIKEKEQNSKSLIQKYLEGQSARVRRNRILITGSFVFLCIYGVLGIPKAHIDTNFVEMVKPGYGLKESYTVIDKFFGGTAGVEILVDTGIQDGTKSTKLLRTMDQFIESIKSEFPDLVTRTRSLVNVTKDSHKNMQDGTDKYYTIPETDAEVAQVLFSFDSADPKSRQQIVDNNWQVARINLGLKTKGTYDYSLFMDKVQELEKKHFSEFFAANTGFQIFHTGSVDTMVRLVNLISQTQIQSFALALGIICVIVLFLFGSFKVGMLAMIPNVFPIVLVTGIAGWFGIPFDSDTLLVIPIAIGIAVDDTIHFLTHYKHEMLEGKSSAEALDISMRKVGQALIFTTVVLTIGFFVFVFSAYIPLTNFGILAAIAISSALFADLYLLPVLLDYLKPFQKGESHDTSELASNYSSSTASAS